MDGLWGESTSGELFSNKTSSLTPNSQKELIKCRPIKSVNAKLSFESDTKAENLIKLNVPTNETVANTIHLLSILRKLRLNSPLTTFEQSVIKEETVFCSQSGELTEGTCLTVDGVRSLLHRSIILLVAHSGYETTNESIVEVLTDVCIAFIEKVCKLLRIESDTKCIKGDNDFPDLIDRVLTDIGFPISVLQHYEVCLRSYRNNLLKEVKRKLSLSTEKCAQPNSIMTYSQIFTSVEVPEENTVYEPEFSVVNNEQR